MFWSEPRTWCWIWCSFSRWFRTQAARFRTFLGFQCWCRGQARTSLFRRLSFGSHPQSKHSHRLFRSWCWLCWPQWIGRCGSRRCWGCRPGRRRWCSGGLSSCSWSRSCGRTCCPSKLCLGLECCWGWWISSSIHNKKKHITVWKFKDQNRHFETLIRKRKRNPTHDRERAAFARRCTLILLPSNWSSAIKSSTSRESEAIDVLENDPTVLRFHALNTGWRLKGSLHMNVDGWRHAWPFKRHWTNHIFASWYQYFAWLWRHACLLPCFHYRLHETNKTRHKIIHFYPFETQKVTQCDCHNVAGAILYHWLWLSFESNNTS